MSDDQQSNLEAQVRAAEATQTSGGGLALGQAMNRGAAQLGAAAANQIDPYWAEQRKREEEQYAAERERERRERYDLQNIVNRQTALHAALMLEPKPMTADELVAASEPILAFLTAK